MSKKKILFICTHNSARSQMAEGMIREFYGDRYNAYSAGTDPGALSPFAVRAMKEIGIDITSHHSKNLSDFMDDKFDHVVTVCDQAKESCPFFPGGKMIHKSFDDPARAKGSESDILAAFRRSRDEIKKWLDESLNEPEPFK